MTGNWRDLFREMDTVYGLDCDEDQPEESTASTKKNTVHPNVRFLAEAYCQVLFDLETRQIAVELTANDLREAKELADDLRAKFDAALRPRRRSTSDGRGLPVQSMLPQSIVSPSLTYYDNRPDRVAQSRFTGRKYGCL